MPPAAPHAREQPQPDVSIDDKVAAAMSAMTDAFARAVKSFRNGCPVPYATSAAANLDAADSSLDAETFLPVCGFGDPHRSNPSDRIGANFSPFVSLFRLPAPRQFYDISLSDEPTYTLVGKAFMPLAPFCQRHVVRPKEYPVEGFVRRGDVLGSWTPVVIHSFDEPTLTYKIEHPSEGVLHVTRQVLRIGEESAGQFDEALDLARADRLRFETQLRRKLFLSLVEDDTARPMPTHMINRILYLSTRRHTDAAAVGRLVDDVREDFSHALAEGRLQYFMLNPRNVEAISHLAMTQATESDIDAAQERETPVVVIKTPPSGRVGLNAQRRQAIARSLEQSMRWGNPTLACLCNIRSLWLAEYASLLCVKLPAANHRGPLHSIDFNAFIAENKAAAETASRLLRIQFTSAVDVIMVEHLKGHFSYSHLTEEAFRASPLGRFFSIIRVDMARNFRSVFDRSLTLLADFFDPSTATVDASANPSEPGTKVDTRFNDELADELYQLRGVSIADRAPLRLTVNVTATDVRLSPSIQRVHDDLLRIVESVIVGLSDIECLENIVMTGIKIEAATVPCGGPNTAEAIRAIDAINRVVDEAAPQLTAITGTMSKFLPIPPLKKDSVLFPPNDLKDTSELMEELEHSRNLCERIRWTAPDLLHCHGFCVDLRAAKEQLIELWRARFEALAERVEEKILETAQKANEAFTHIHGRLISRPTCAEEMQELMTFSVDALKQLSSIERKDCRHVLGWVRVLESVLHAVSPDVTAVVLEMFQWPSKLDEHFASSDGMVKRERQFMITELEDFAQSINDKIAQAAATVDELYFVCEVERIDSTDDTIQSVRAILESVTSQIRTLHRRQDIFEQPRTPFDMLPSIMNNFEAIEQFWGAVRDSTYGLQQYYDQPVSMLAPEKMIDNAEQWRAHIRAATRSLRGFPETYNIGRRIEAQLARFQDLLPTIELLKAPGMRPSHWRDLSRSIREEQKAEGAADRDDVELIPLDKDLHPSDQALTLQRLMDMEIHRYHATVAEMANNATKEYNIENRLEQMKQDARLLRLQFDDLGDESNMRVLGNVDEVLPILENQIAATQHMRASPHIAGQANTAQSWETMLTAFHTTLQLWLQVQEQWLQLHPVMVQSSAAIAHKPTAVVRDNSDGDDGDQDVIAELPMEDVSAPQRVVQQYANADSTYHTIIDEVDRTQHSIISVMTLESLPTRLAEVLATLKDVRADVLSLMDAKRAVFPRFYFVSDVQMLSCLSSADMAAVAPLLQQMYCSLSHLEISRSEVVAFIAQDGTRLTADVPVALANEPIEVWMQRLDRALRHSMVSNLELCFKEFARAPLRSWLFKWAGQFVDVALRAHFSHDIRQVIEATGGKGLNAYSKKQQRVMQEFTNISRSRATLKASEVTILCNAIIQQLQNRDTLASMIDDGVATLGQLEAFPFFRVHVDEQTRRCHVSLLQTTTPYSYEFLGSPGGPISTPEFFTSARSLALSAHCGGHSMLMGPTGVGKTETVRGLGIMYGRFVWAYQCTETSTLESFQTILRGAVNIGAWISFEDVDLLNDTAAYELAMVAQAVASSKRSNAPCRLHESMDATYTLHPDFALVGTTNLPLHEVKERLHPLLVSSFRPLHIHEPTFANIEAVLLGNGLEAASQRLAPKLTEFFVAGRSYAPHIFTFGRLAAVVRAASLSDYRSQPETAAAIAIFRLVVSALPSVFVPAALDHLNALDLGVPEAELAQAEDAATHQRQRKLGEPNVLTEMANAFDHLLVTGPSFAGKSSVARQVAAVTNSDLIELAPRAVVAASMWGRFEMHAAEKTWVRGVIDNIANACSKPGPHVIQFDGLPTLADEFIWVPIFDTQRRAISTGGTSALVTRQTRVVFKTASLDDATPRLVSRCGIVHLANPRRWQDVLESALDDADHPFVGPNTEAYVALAETIVPALEEAADRFSANVRGGSLQCRVFVAARVFDRMMLGAGDAADMHIQAALQLFLFAIFWAFAGAMTPRQRSEMETALAAVAEAATASARDSDSSVDLFPSGTITTQYPTLSGWRHLSRHGEDVGGIDEGEVSFGGMYPSPDATSNVALLRLFVSRSIGTLSVMTPDNGLSRTLKVVVNSLRSSLDTVVAACSRDSTTSGLIDLMDKSLQRRRDKLYGPPAGKQLVVVVDDVHLPTKRAEDGTETRPALLLSAFSQLRGMHISAANGVVGIEDVFFAASIKTGTPIADQYRRAFLTVRLQPFSDAGMQAFLHAASQTAVAETPQLSHVVREGVNFLIDAYRAAIADPMKREGEDIVFSAVSLLVRCAKATVEVAMSKASDGMIPKCIVSETRRIFASLSPLDAPQLFRALDTAAVQNFALISAEAKEAVVSGSAMEEYAARYVAVDDEGGTFELVDGRAIERRMADVVEALNDHHAKKISLASAHKDDRSNNRVSSHKDRVVQVVPHVIGRIFATRHVLHHGAVLANHLREPMLHACVTGGASSCMTPLLTACFASNATAVFVSESSTAIQFTYDDWCREMRTAFRLGVKPGEKLMVFVPPTAIHAHTDKACTSSVLADIDSIIRQGIPPPAILREDEIQQADGQELELVAKQVRFILMVPTEEEFDTLCAGFPSLRSMLRYHIDDAEHNDEELSEIGATILAAEPALEDQAEPLAEIATTIFNKLIEKTPRLQRRDYVNFVSLVAELHRAREPEVRRMLDQNTLLGKTIATLQDEEAKSSQYRKDLLPQVSQLNDEILGEERKLSKLSEDIDGMKGEFQQLESTTVNIVSNLEAKKHTIQQLNEAVAVQLADARNGVIECDAKQVTNLRLSISPPAKVKSLMEGVCLLLGEKPEKNVRGSLTPDFWTLSRRLMEDPAFTERILSLEAGSPCVPADPSSMDEYVEACETNRFTSFSTFAQALADWLIAMVTSMKYKAETDTLAEEVQGGQEEMLKMVEGLEQRRDNLNANTKKVNQIRAGLERLRTVRSKLQTELDACEGRLSSATRVVAMVSALSDQYHQEYLRARSLEQNLVGDVLLTSVSLTCLMALGGTDHDDALAATATVLADHELTTTSDFNIRKVITPDCPLLRHEVRGIRLPPHLTDAVAALSVRAFPAWPLFLSELPMIEAVVEDQLRYSFNDLVIVSMHAANASDMLLAALRAGCVCLVREAFGDIPPEWRPVLEMAPRLRNRAEPLDVTFMRQEVSVRPGFQLVFVSHRPFTDEVLSYFTVVQCDAEAGVTQEAWSQQLLTMRPVTDPDNEFATEMKDLQRLESRRLTSRDAVSQMIRTHAATIIDRPTLIDQLDEQITNLLRATSTGGSVGERASSDDDKRREPTNLLANFIDHLFVALRQLSRVLPVCSVSITVWTELVNRAYTLNRTVSGNISKQRLHNVSPFNEQVLVASFFAHSVADMFLPSFTPSMLPIAAAWLSVTLCAHPLMVEKSPGWFKPYHRASIANALLPSDAAARWGSADAADAMTESRMGVSMHSDLKEAAAAAPPTPRRSASSARAINDLEQALRDRDQLRVIDAATRTVEACGRGLMRGISEASGGSGPSELRVEIKHPAHLAEATGLPMSCVADGGPSSALLHIQRRGYADQCQVDFAAPVDPARPYQLADDVRKRVAVKTAATGRKGVWHVAVIPDSPEGFKAAEAAIAALIELAAAKKFEGRENVYQLWFVFISRKQRAVRLSDVSIGPHWRPLLNHCLQVSLGPSNAREHVQQLLTYGPAYPRDWRDGVGYPTSKLAVAAVLLHVALQNRDAFGAQGSIAALGLNETDLSVVLALLRKVVDQRDKSVFTVSEPYATMRFVAYFVYAGRCSSVADRSRLQRFVKHFVSRALLQVDFFFAGLVPVGNGDLYDTAQRYFVPAQKDGAMFITLASSKLTEDLQRAQGHRAFALLKDPSASEATMPLDAILPSPTTRMSTPSDDVSPVSGSMSTRRRRISVASVALGRRGSLARPGSGGIITTSGPSTPLLPSKPSAPSSRPPSRPGSQPLPESPSTTAGRPPARPRSQPTPTNPQLPSSARPPSSSSAAAAAGEPKSRQGSASIRHRARPPLVKLLVGHTHVAHGLWRIEDALLGRREVDVSSAGSAFVARARESLSSLMGVTVARVTSIWLSGLANPALFLRVWFDARAAELPGAGDEAQPPRTLQQPGSPRAKPVPRRQPAIVAIVTDDPFDLNDSDCRLVDAIVVADGDLARAVRQPQGAATAIGVSATIVALRVERCEVEGPQHTTDASAVVSELGLNVDRQDDSFVPTPPRSVPLIVASRGGDEHNEGTDAQVVAMPLIEQRATAVQAAKPTAANRNPPTTAGSGDAAAAVGEGSSSMRDPDALLEHQHLIQCVAAPRAIVVAH